MLKVWCIFIKYVCFTGGHIGKWLSIAFWAEFSKAPYLKISIGVWTKILPSLMLLTQFEQFVWYSSHIRLTKCKYWRPTGDRRLLIWKIWNGRSWSSDSLHVWFKGVVFGVGGSNGAISGSNKSKMAAYAILRLGNFRLNICLLWNGLSTHFHKIENSFSGILEKIMCEQ